MNSNFKIILFSEEDFCGECLVFFDKQTFGNLNDFPFRDFKFKSLIAVRGGWEVGGHDLHNSLAMLYIPEGTQSSISKIQYFPTYVSCIEPCIEFQ